LLLAPRDFIIRLSKFHSFASAHDANGQSIEDSVSQTTRSPEAGDMIQQTASYIEKWGMKIPPENGADHPIDKEWKILSGGESQRMLLAIAMASRPRVLLLDEATSGLDSESERKVEKSVKDYVKTHNAAVLWVTHSDDIAERMLK
jgi:ABC-type glutathione transport system ATPase component